MSMDPSGLAAAVGIGLLIGLERERRHAKAPMQSAGIRTFALASLLGALSISLGPAVLIASAATVGIVATAAIIQAKAVEPGITTEVALLVTLLLGALAMEDVTAAAGLGVIVTVLLAIRTPLHKF